MHSWLRYDGHLPVEPRAFVRVRVGRWWAHKRWLMESTQTTRTGTNRTVTSSSSFLSLDSVAVGFPLVSNRLPVFFFFFYLFFLFSCWRQRVGAVQSGLEVPRAMSGESRSVAGGQRRQADAIVSFLFHGLFVSPPFLLFLISYQSNYLKGRNRNGHLNSTGNLE